MVKRAGLKILWLSACAGSNPVSRIKALKMVKILVVNEEDNIINSKERGTLNQEEIYRVSALWIKDSKEQILLARRAYAKKKDPGMWEPAVAGTVEEGETYESNIIKKAEEELGLDNIKLEKGPKHRVKGKHNHFTQWFILCVDKDINDFKVKEDEVAEIRWFSKDKILKLIKNNPKEVIEALKKNINLLLEI